MTTGKLFRIFFLRLQQETEAGRLKAEDWQPFMRRIATALDDAGVI